MCGVCGWVAPAGEGLAPEISERMRDVLEHRGPDGPGGAAVGAEGLEGWLGHRRLKILDLTEAAHQPMWSADGRVALTFNGEIYNFRELRRELEAAGHRFTSTGDTEVILRAYEAWGEGAIARLDGMFALAVWDGREGRLLLARDRVGKKPLYYATAGGRLAFGSEIKSLLQCPWVRPRVAADRLAEFLAFGYVPWPDTLLEGVHQVPPGCSMTFGRDGMSRPREFWSPRPAAVDLRPGGDVTARIAELLDAATHRRMVSDVPLGALLSGGIDSSLVVGLMARHAPEPIHTFSIGFADDASFDERSWARTVSEHFGTRHVEHVVQLDAVDLLDRLVWHHDQPFHDSSAIPTYLVSGFARQAVTVVLNGDGGDEVFVGYDRFKAAVLSPSLPPVAARAARALAGLLPENHGYYSPRRRARRFFEQAEGTLEERYDSWTAVMRGELLQGLLRPEVPLDAVRTSQARFYDEVRDLPRLDRLVHANFRTYLPDDLCVKMDRMSMAHSLEARSPFLDPALIEYVRRIPALRRVGLRQVKPLLRRAFGPMLPDAIWERRKHGFGVPTGPWFRGELGTMFEDEVLAADARSSAYLRTDALGRLLAEHRTGEAEHGFRLWTVLTLERWLRSLEHPPALRPPADPVRDAAVLSG